MKIGVLKILAKLTRKRLCQSLFLNKVAGLKVELCQMSVRKPLQSTLQLFNSNFLELGWIAVIMSFYGFIKSFAVSLDKTKILSIKHS